MFTKPVTGRTAALAFACFLIGWGTASASEEARGVVIASSTPIARIVRYEAVVDLQIRPQDRPPSSNVDMIVAFSLSGIQYELRLRKDAAAPRGGGCELYKTNIAGWPELFMACGPPHYFGTLAIAGVEQPRFSVAARVENATILARLVESGESFKFLWLEPKSLYDARAQDSEYIFYSEENLTRPGGGGVTDALPVWYRHEPRMLEEITSPTRAP